MSILLCFSLSFSVSGVCKNHLISCSKLRNKSELKKSEIEISKPSQSFFKTTTPISRLCSSSKLYTVEGVTPESVAKVLYFIPFCLHNSLIRITIASLIPKKIISCKYYLAEKSFYFLFQFCKFRSIKKLGQGNTQSVT